jgi:uncharacterized protein YndB with AHSA1/START domain
MENHTSTASVTAVVNAPIERIYDLVTDVTRMGEWSPECVGADLDEDHAGRVGTQFTGRNARGGNEWTSPCVVVAAERPRLFSFTAGDPEAATTWSYELRALDDGTTEVTESFDSVPLRTPELVDQLDGRHSQLSDDMATTLDALKAAAEEPANR